ncbi:MAG: hypothetical protein LBU15_00600 [Rickettsiales bacterium]|jgi:hypothetical protein|nr:hypothetical protein [Rickettsiales bacterium]
MVANGALKKGKKTKDAEEKVEDKSAGGEKKAETAVVLEKEKSGGTMRKTAKDTIDNGLGKGVGVATVVAKDASVATTKATLERLFRKAKTTDDYDDAKMRKDIPPPKVQNKRNKEYTGP